MLWLTWAFISLPFSPSFKVSHNYKSIITLSLERLLNMISQILSGKPYRHPGSPEKGLPSQVAMSLREVQVVGEGKDVETFVLALRTLGSFDFTGYLLIEFIRDCVCSYLDDDNADIRKSAALCSSRVLIADRLSWQNTLYSNQLVDDILGRLLTVGIADSEADIRQSVLLSLDARFDSHLCQAQFIRSLFVALNDEVFAIRELAVSIIGRLSFHNPAYVLPSLRKTLIQLLTELEYSPIRCETLL